MGPSTLTRECLVIAALVLFASYASAGQQFTVSGTLNYMQDSTAGTKITNGSFTAVVNYNSGVAGTSSSGFYGTVANWSQSVTSIDYHVKDASGAEVFSDTVLSSSNDPYAFIYSITTAQDSSNYQMLQWVIYNASSAGSASALVSFSDPSRQLFIAASQYPDPKTLTGHSGNFSFSSSAGGHAYQGQGVVTNVSSGPADSDGDGITDNMDSCPHSDLSANVTINGVDSGVPNTLQIDGCTLMDMLGSDSSADHVAHVTNEMRKEGLISGSNKGAIQSAAGKSN